MILPSVQNYSKPTSLLFDFIGKKISKEKISNHCRFVCLYEVENVNFDEIKNYDWIIIENFSEREPKNKIVRIFYKGLSSLKIQHFNFMNQGELTTSTFHPNLHGTLNPKRIIKTSDKRLFNEVFFDSLNPKFKVNLEDIGMGDIEYFVEEFNKKSYSDNSLEINNLLNRI